MNEHDELLFMGGETDTTPPAAAPKAKRPAKITPISSTVTEITTATVDAPAAALPKAAGYYTAPAPSAADPFDLATLAAPQHIQHAREITTSELVTIGRPAPDRAFRVHPGPEWDTMLAVLSLSASVGSGTRRSVVGGEKYLLTAAVAGQLEQERPGTVKWRRLAWWLDDTGALGLWPVAGGGNSGNENPWIRSALACVAAARGQWVRVSSDTGAGKFRCYKASKTETPAWPQWSMSDVLRRAFGENLIATTEHVALAHLAGDEISTS
jgi:hypothetical protein